MSSSSALSLEPKPTPMRLMESRKKFIETNLDSTTSSFSMSSLSSMTVVTKTSTSPVSLIPLPPATKAATTTKFSAPPPPNSDDTTIAVVRTPPVSINQILIPDKDKDTTTTTTTSTNTKAADTSRIQSGLGSASFHQTRRPYAQSPSYEVIIQPRLNTATATATKAGASAPLARQESSSMSSTTTGGELNVLGGEEKLEHFNGLHNFESKNKSTEYGGVVKKRGGVGMCFGTMILISDCLLCHGEPSY